MSILDTFPHRAVRSALGLAATISLSSGCGTGVISAPSGSGGELAGGSASIVGANGGNGPGAADAAPASFSCDPDAQQVESAPLRRLTRRQYTQSLEDWLTAVLGTRSDATAVLDGVLDTVPSDERAISAQDLHGSLRRLDQVVSDPHVRSWFTVSTDVGNALTDPVRLEQAFGPCATDGDSGNDARCIDDFVRTHGSRLLRKPLDDATVAFYRGFYGDTNAATEPLGFGDVVAGLLNAPEFLYVVDHGQDPSGAEGGTHPLSAHELAARLALHFWDSLPDDRLWAAAEDGSLLDDDVYAAEVSRLANSARAKTTIREFYRDWLKLEDLPDLTAKNGFPVFRAFAGNDLPTPSLRGHMIDEVLDSLEYHTYTNTDGVEELLLSPFSFARTDDLANIYGVPTWDGQGTPPRFRDADRVGLLTRAALLSTGTANTRPIMKGVFIRRTLLCDVIPPPPDNSNADIPPLSENLSTRQVVEGLTEVEGTSCPSCHQSYINPLGFPTEVFDSLGRYRTTQELFDEEGRRVGEAPIDPVTSPRVSLSDEAEVDGAAGLAQEVLESGKFEACMARSYFRFSMGRFESLEADGCALEKLRTALTDAESIAEMLEIIALDETFKMRTFGS